VGIDLERERERLTRVQTRLQDQKRELDARSNAVDREFRKLVNQKAAYRCPRCGLGVDGCFALGNPPPQTIAFAGYIRSRAGVLSRENENLGRALQRWSVQAKSLVDQKREFERNLESYKSQVGAKRSRRSPDEGLYFDDSVRKD
jgi:hypothetical protein